MDLQSEYKGNHLLDRNKRINLSNAVSEQRPNELVLGQKPKFMQKFSLGWWWHCLKQFLIVTDSSLNSGTKVYGLSEFITTYHELDS